ncbi:2-oxoglutarate-dependent dioxygenase AOP3 isoform X2 [Cucumis sativus]|uniref:2-oxoglutarate-dependent dioxygenase AOP3 isoform X2 n=1 Tax=Cucumis sativus TaxID=3659 RepID=UPI0012F487D4|nr:2-oxoglutarate-dependent dioxygenase AOP3 isoform X2 [Cucumis sativus]
MGSETTEEIRLPVINFSDEKVKAEGGVEWRRTSKNVREAMEEYGCFIAKYEGVSKELREEVLKAVKELFELPIERKKMNKYEKPFNGYVGELRTLPLHESLGIDDATNFNQVQSFSHLMWPPEGNHHFRVLKSKAPQSPDPTLCLVDHTDKSFTTMVYQDHINGLELKTKNGQWIQVDNSSPSSFLVIAGDAIKAWSNDRIESPTHKVTIRGNEDRYSLAMFGFSNGIVEVPKELVDQNHPLRYKPFDHIGLLHFFRSKEGFNSKSPLKDYCAI